LSAYFFDQIKSPKVYQAKEYPKANKIIYIHLPKSTPNLLARADFLAKYTAGVYGSFFLLQFQASIGLIQVRWCPELMLPVLNALFGISVLHFFPAQ